MDIDKLYDLSRRDLLTAQALHKDNLSRIERLRPMLEALPDEPMPSASHWYSSLVIYYFTEDNDQAERLRSAVQAVIHTPAKRSVDYIGGLQYEFKTDEIKITITNGSLAPNCKLEEYTEPVTKFRVVCD